MAALKGRSLYPVIVALHNWGSEWAGDENGPAATLVHNTCGQPAHPAYHCTACGDRLELSSLQPVSLRDEH